MALSTVRLMNAVFYAHHGVEQEEHRIGGRFEVDVSMDLCFEEAARNDDLTKTVDYARVYRLAEEIVTSNNFRLLERLAYMIAGKILDEYAFVERIEVTVRKPHPPIGGTSESAEAIYRASR